MKRSTILLAATLAALAGCGRPAQIGADPASFKAVDALYTAISLRDPKLVEQSEQSLGGLKSADKLPGPAAKTLDAIIAEAKGGRWEAAQGHLGDFMRGQRR